MFEMDAEEVQILVKYCVSNSEKLHQCPLYSVVLDLLKLVQRAATGTTVNKRSTELPASASPSEQNLRERVKTLETTIESIQENQQRTTNEIKQQLSNTAQMCETRLAEVGCQCRDIHEAVDMRMNGYREELRLVKDTVGNLSSQRSSTHNPSNIQQLQQQHSQLQQQIQQQVKDIEVLQERISECHQMTNNAVMACSVPKHELHDLSCTVQQSLATMQQHMNERLTALQSLVQYSCVLCEC